MRPCMNCKKVTDIDSIFSVMHSFCSAGCSKAFCINDRSPQVRARDMRIAELKREIAELRADKSKLLAEKAHLLRELVYFEMKDP